jgi:hypothetical protein
MKSINFLALNDKEKYELFSHGALAVDTVEQKKEVTSKVLTGLKVELEEVFEQMQEKSQ